MKLVNYHGVLAKEYVGKILKSFDKFQVVWSSMKVFTTNLNGSLAPTVSRPREGRAGRDTVGTGYPMEWPSWTWCQTWWNHSWHITLNQCCFAFIRLRTPQVYSYHCAYSELQCWCLVAPHREQPSDAHRGVCHLNNLFIGRIAWGRDDRHWRMQRQSLDLGIWSINIVGIPKAHQC